MKKPLLAISPTGHYTMLSQKATGGRGCIVMPRHTVEDVSLVLLIKALEGR